MPNLVMVMPYKAYLLAAKQEGFRVCAIWDPSLSSVMPTSPRDFPAYLEELRGIADEFVLTDFDDEVGFADVVAQAAKDFDADLIYHVGQENSMLATYRVAEQLDKAVNPAGSIELLNDKLAMRRLLAEHGVSTIKFAAADRWQDVAALLDDFTLPVVVKPTELAGSRGVFLLRSRDELAEWGRLLDSYGYAGQLLVEEYLQGQEYSVETISVEGVHHVIGVTTKSLSEPPLFVETGHLHPTPESPATKAIADLAVELLTLTGYRTGPAHTEVISTAGGPKLVESQARLAGDRIPVLVKLATGFDINQAIFRALAGRPLDPVVPQRYARVAYLEYPTGVLRSVDGLDAVRALDFVAELSFPFVAGDVIPPVVDSKTRHGYVVLHGASPEEVVERVAEVRSMIDVHVG
ncbi:ATP-grasp domain-containing protein [Amycolatopsis sp. NPDC026612]|uniref:ATP-grasp domain-containing protein n=1 Tax=Amycolatopsis sp. NPDC026612 TaxID=3155466 RepID=UPI0034030D48